MMINVLVLLLSTFMLVLLPIRAVNAESSSSLSITPVVEKRDQPNENRFDFQHWLKDTEYVISRPKHWGGTSDWERVLLYTGVTCLVYNNDNYIQNWFQERRSSGTDKWAKIGNEFPTVAGVYLTGTYFFGNDKQRKVSVNGLESAGVALVVTESLKLLSHRHRPDANNGPKQWDGPKLSENNSSFPSVHTAAAFALATVFADEYHDNRVVPPLAYGLATLTAYGRLNDNRHWGSDVLVGGLIGYYTAKTVMKLNNSQTFQVQPYIDGDKTGMVINKKI